MKILFIANSTSEIDASRIYRGINQLKQLKRYGWEVKLIDQFSINTKIIEKKTFIIFQRCIFTKDLLRIYKLGRKLNCIIFTEFDDLIFLPHLMKTSGAIRSKTINNIKATLSNSLSRFKLIPLSDYTIVSTQELYNQIKLIGGVPILSRNTLDDENIKKNKVIRNGKLQRILYMSGSNTHNADFMLMFKGLLSFLKEFKDVSLSILGEVDIPKELKELDNVFIYKKISYSELFTFVSNHDLSLVPLENTLFNHAKSSLKFYEAGYMFVASLASPVYEFNNDINHNNNGFLVKDNNWYDSLKKLYNNEELLYNAKINSHNDVLKKYTITGRQDYLHNIFYDIYNNNKEQK